MEKLSKSQAAALAKCCEKSLERAIALGELPAKREHGRIAISESDLRKWIAARQSRGRRTTPAIDALDYVKQITGLTTETEDVLHG